MRLAGLAVVPLFAVVALAQEAPKPAAPPAPAPIPAPGPAPTPGPATPAAPAPAPPADAAKPAAPAKPVDPYAVPELVGSDGIRRADGMVVHFYHVNYVTADVLATELLHWTTARGKVEAELPMYQQLPGLLGPFPGPTKPPTLDRMKDVLRIEDVEENWPVLRRVLDVVDVPQLEVLVEAKIVEILFSDDLHFGATASLKRPLGDTFFQGSEAKFPNLVDATNQFTSTFHDAGKYYAFDYIVDLVDRGAKTKIVSKPAVFATQGETAIVHVGDNEPIVQQNFSGGTVSTSTNFQQTGLRLEVQPLLVGRDGVRARISAESSRVSEFRVTATSTDTQVVNPVVSTRNADTVVTVLDGETLVIGGLDQTSDVESRTGIPLLMDIPLLGNLFGSTTKTKGNSQIVFFLTFHIMTPAEARIVKPPSEKERTGE